MSSQAFTTALAPQTRLRHAVPLRGLMSTPTSPSYEGRFGRMFRSLRPAVFGSTEAEITANLTALADLMKADFDEPKDGQDEEESGIPALYTYLGQFIDHDITFDPASSLQKQNDPNALVDFRTPAFDLDNVYGRGPDDQPYMYQDDRHFLLGDKLEGGDPNAADLPRNKAGRALIGDPRNDENSIVSQLQGLFLRFHNRMADENPGLRFEDVQQRVRFHYQYMVLNDFLPRIVSSKVLSALKDGKGYYDHEKLKFFHWKNDPFMPVEFSVAAYRLGHSMIRPGYRLNDSVLLPIFPVAPDFPEGLTGFRTLNSQWGIDWGRFIDTEKRTYDGSADQNKQRLQFAYRIDTSLVNPLANLPLTVTPHDSTSLPLRNLERGWRLCLPSGQAVAKAMNVEPLPDEKILIGKAVDEDPTFKSIVKASPVFKGNCPLWAYILAEAIQNVETVKIPVTEDKSITTPKLGPVGGRIVAEVFVGLMYGDRHSMLRLDPHWKPTISADFRLKDFVQYALGK